MLLTFLLLLAIAAFGGIGVVSGHHGWYTLQSLAFNATAAPAGGLLVKALLSGHTVSALFAAAAIVVALGTGLYCTMSIGRRSLEDLKRQAKAEFAQYLEGNSR